MASIVRKPGSKFWHAAYRDHQGRQRRKSTRETDFKKAYRIAQLMERAAKHKIRTDRVRHAIREVFDEFYPDELPSTTTREHATQWLALKKPEVATSTYVSYKKSVSKFLANIGELADQDMSDVRKANIAQFRDSLLVSVSPTTVNHDIKTVKAIFKSAKRDGYISDDPAESIEMVRRSTDRVRRPFTVDELRAILEVATPEWQSLIKFGLYTGQRLGDLARLTWSNLDLERNVIRLQARKTGKAMTIPIAEPLRNHILCLPVPSKPSAPIHPRAFRTAGHRLSNQFVDLLVVVGLRQKQKRTGAGRGGRRQPSEVSFHVLRHTCTTLLKHAGVPQAVVQELIGHQSPAMSGVYTHVGETELAKATSALPAL